MLSCNAKQSILTFLYHPLEPPYLRMSTLPTPPFISVSDVANFRALLLPASHDAKANAKLYRSASPAHITPAGIKTLHELGISTIFDLSSSPEIEKRKAAGDTLRIEGIKRIHAPVFTDQNYSPESIALRFKNYVGKDTTAGFVKAYTEILESGGPAFKQVLSFLRDQPEKKCLVHCSAGKDRTGILCALVLMLVGVSDEAVAEEYALTDLGLEEIKAEMVERLLKMETLEGNREGVEKMVGSRKESMLATIDLIRREYGGVEGYLHRKCDLRDEDLTAIRSNIMKKG